MDVLTLLFCKAERREVSVAVVRHCSLQEWADQVNVHVEKAAASVIAAGRVLIDAKADKPHGEWERLFAGHPQAVKQPVRFTIGTAERLMVIARHQVLSKSAHAPTLPSSWMTLYELTKLPDATLTTALRDGRVHPGMERREARALREPMRARQATRPWDEAAAIRRIDAVIDSEVERAPDAEARRAIGGALRHRAHFLEKST